MSSILIGLAMVGVAAVIFWIAKVEKDSSFQYRGPFAYKQDDEEQ